MLKQITILLLFLCIGQVTIFAQEKLQDPGPHQIFLDKPIMKIKTLEYHKSGEKIPHKLTPEKDNILIPNYDGKSKVLIEYYDQNGVLKRIVKSRCFIDPQMIT